MNSLDYELQNLKKPIPNGTDLEWLTSGGTFYQSDTNNPNSQAADMMSQLAFNRIITKRDNCKLMPEERAVGQTVIAHITSGYQGQELDKALLGVFGREVLNRHASFIQDVKNIYAQNIDQLPQELRPNIGVNLASPSNGQSDREALRKHAAKLSSEALTAYKSKDSTMKDGSISLGESEVEVDLTKTKKDASIRLSEGSIDQIKLAAQNLVGNQDLGLEEQATKESENIFEGDIPTLKHTQETELISSGKEELDLAFENGPTDLGNEGFDLNTKDAIVSCDQDLADVAGVPPRALLESDSIFRYDEVDVCPEDDEKIELEEKPQKEDLEIGMSDEFEIEI